MSDAEQDSDGSLPPTTSRAPKKKSGEEAGTPGRPKKIQPKSSFSKYKKEDVIKLLELIEASPELWSGCDENYHRTEVKNCTWRSIEKECNFLVTSRSGKGDNAKFLWNDLLKGFKTELKNVKNRPSGSGSHYKITFPYFYSMQFYQTAISDRAPNNSYIIGSGENDIQPSGDNCDAKYKRKREGEKMKAESRNSFLKDFNHVSEVLVTSMQKIASPSAGGNGLFADFIDYLTDVEKKFEKRSCMRLKSELFNLTFQHEDLEIGRRQNDRDFRQYAPRQDYDFENAHNHNYEFENAQNRDYEFEEGHPMPMEAEEGQPMPMEPREGNTWDEFELVDM